MNQGREDPAPRRLVCGWSNPSSKWLERCWWTVEVSTSRQATGSQVVITGLCVSGAALCALAAELAGV